MLFSLSSQKFHPLPSVSFLPFVIFFLVHFQFYKQNDIKLLQLVKRSHVTRAVRKVSSHFGYLENRSRGLDITWQPVRGDLAVHPWTVTIPWVSSVSSETPLTELVHCVTVVFTITERADQLHYDNAPVHSTALVQAFLARHHITQVCQPPYSTDLVPSDFWFFPKLKPPLKGRVFVNGRSHSTLAQSKASHCRLTSPTGEWLFTDAQ